MKVININQGRNDDKLKRCKMLASYSAFVGKVHENESVGLDREESIRKAINYCIENDMLREFFEKNATEVMNMLILDWNMEDALTVSREEGREEGLMQTARNALLKGYPINAVQEITGLDMQTLTNISGEIGKGT